MKSIRDTAGQELRWIKPRVLGGEYQLQDGDHLLA